MLIKVFLLQLTSVAQIEVLTDFAEVSDPAQRLLLAGYTLHVWMFNWQIILCEALAERHCNSHVLDWSPHLLSDRVCQRWKNRFPHMLLDSFLDVDLDETGSSASCTLLSPPNFRSLALWAHGCDLVFADIAAVAVVGELFKYLSLLVWLLMMFFDRRLALLQHPL